MSILSRPPEKIRRKKRVKNYAHNAGACAKYSRKYSPELQKGGIYSRAPRHFAAAQILILNAIYSVRLSLPKKNSATVPGPVCEPITVPMGLISTSPSRLGNAPSTIALSWFASASIIEWQI